MIDRWHINNKTTRQCHMGSYTCSFLSDGFFGDLYGDLLAFAQEVLNGLFFRRSRPVIIVPGAVARVVSTRPMAGPPAPVRRRDKITLIIGGVNRRFIFRRCVWADNRRIIEQSRWRRDYVLD